MNFTKIKNEAYLYKKSPSSNVWDVLEKKLNDETTKPHKNQVFKILSYAAGFSGFIIISYFLFYTSQSDSGKNKPQFETVELNVSSYQIYSPEKITSLKYAYAKLSFPDSSQKTTLSQ
ncbi:MAG: hypothetical protein IPG18_01205 [Saprospiraceae bacterium]|nr:hypothetical protein [Saprospiraceae bacterium]MBK6563827.1 hypothetical protein [Saprospiraceae bacterium]